VAAARTGRRYVGYDLDPDYIALAERRVAAALAEPGARPAADAADADAAGNSRARHDDARHDGARASGATAKTLAEEALVAAGFEITDRNRRIRGSGVTVAFVATDADGGRWHLDVAGPFTAHHGGLLRTEAVWRALGRASALRGHLPDAPPLVLLTSHLPRRPGEGDTALRAAGPDAFFDAVDLLDDDSCERLAYYAKGGYRATPRVGFWTAADLTRRTGSTP
jgi:hypothetical protein